MRAGFDLARWFTEMRAAGHDLALVEFVPGDAQLVVIGRYAHARDRILWAPLVEHRAAIEAFVRNAGAELRA